MTIEGISTYASRPRHHVVVVKWFVGGRSVEDELPSRLLTGVRNLISG